MAVAKGERLERTPKTQLEMLSHTESVWPGHASIGLAVRRSVHDDW